MPRRLAEQTNTVRTPFTLKPFALHHTGSLLLFLKACAYYLQKFMHDFKSRGLCSFGPCFASCFKKMRNSKM